MFPLFVVSARSLKDIDRGGHTHYGPSQVVGAAPTLDEAYSILRELGAEVGEVSEVRRNPEPGLHPSVVVHTWLRTPPPAPKAKPRARRRPVQAARS